MVIKHWLLWLEHCCYDNQTLVAMMVMDHWLLWYWTLVAKGTGIVCHVRTAFKQKRRYILTASSALVKTTTPKVIFSVFYSDRDSSTDSLLTLARVKAVSICFCNSYINCAFEKDTGPIWKFGTPDPFEGWAHKTHLQDGHTRPIWKLSTPDPFENLAHQTHLKVGHTRPIWK